VYCFFSVYENIGLFYKAIFSVKIFVCFIKQACLLAIISQVGGGDNSILLLSFAQQK
jgi:hypothetical protein